MHAIVTHNLFNVYQYQCLGLHNQEVHKKHHRVFHVNVKLLIRKKWIFSESNLLNVKIIKLNARYHK